VIIVCPGVIPQTQGRTHPPLELNRLSVYAPLSSRLRVGIGVGVRLGTGLPVEVGLRVEVGDDSIVVVTDGVDDIIGELFSVTLAVPEILMPSGIASGEFVGDALLVHPPMDRDTNSSSPGIKISGAFLLISFPYKIEERLSTL
jgi:hypothetical protein